MSASVIRHRQNIRNNGLEIPCLFRVKPSKSKAIQAECIIKKYLKQMNKKQ